MATNKPPTRTTHISRIFGTNKKGERLDDIWADVERMDVVKSASQVPPVNQWQKIVRKLKWCDDPGKADYNQNGNKNRKTEVLKVCDPENTDDINDPDEWIPIRVIKSVKSTGGSGLGEDYQDSFLVSIINNELRAARAKKVRRTVHYDTNIDKLVQAAIDGDKNLKEFVVSSEHYTKDLESKDKDQYVEQEIPLGLKGGGNSLFVNGQARQTKLLNQYLVDESEPATQKIKGKYDLNPPYRLDPFQSIVNVNFAPKVYVIIGASHGDFAVPNSGKAEVIATRSSSDLFSGDGSPVTAVLLECSANAGEDVIRLETSYSSVLGSVELVFAFVCPKTDAVKDNWFDYVVGQCSDVGFIPTGPFWWKLSGQGGNGQPMHMGAPTLLKFKIRHAAHLTPPALGQNNKMVQFYPMTGSNAWSGGSTAGWGVSAYRTDKKGTDQTFQTPPEWQTDDVVFITGAGAPAKGLLFGKDPPLIAADIPKPP